MKSRISLSLLALFVATMTLTSVADTHDHDKGGKKDIVATAIEAGTFKTLTTALTAAGLVSALQGDGPFTVFAPTDEAFAKLPKGTLEKLLADPEALKSILLYHVVKGSVTASEAMKLDKAETLSGKSIKIKVKGGNVMINSSKVTAADVMASNGVIHVIDTVLLPK